MTMKAFKAHGNKYQFVYQLNFWGETELILFENGEEVGLLNVNYSVEEGERIVKNNEEFKKSDAIIWWCGYALGLWLQKKSNHKVIAQ